MSALKKDGFVRVPNEIIEALISADLTKRELKIMLLIVRQTIGYNRDKCEISLDFISKKTGLKPSHIGGALRSLQDKKFIFYTRGERRNDPQIMAINPNISEWAGITDLGIPKTGIPKTGIPKTVTPTYQNGNSEVTKTVTPTIKRQLLKTSLKTLSAQERESDKKTVQKKEVFTPPTVEEVRAYCEERHNGIDPEQFVSFYAAKGWMIGKNKMVNWKRAVITWECNRKEKSQQNATNITDYEPVKYDEQNGGYRDKNGDFWV